jgi:hypothetical protein
MPIQLKQALRDMESGKPFHIAFFTFDKQKETGGQRIEFEKAIKNPSDPGDDNVNANVPKTVEQFGFKRNPRHSKNRTRNIMILPSQEIRKLHIALITQFNHQNVMY